MPFSATVFDHTRFLDGFDKEDRTTFVGDDLLFQMAMEAHGNPHIFTLENYLINKVTAAGYSIEFSQAGRQYTVTDKHQNRIMYLYWEREIKAMLRSILRYGFCAVRYCKLDTAAGSSPQFVPRCMDPVAEYSMRFRINDDGTRDYLAYARAKVAQDKPIPNSRVFLMYEPEADGTLQSPLQKCFTEIQRLRGYWERSEQQDFRNSNPVYIYEIESKDSSIIPAGLPDEALAEYEAGQVVRAQGQLPLQYNQLQQMYSQEMGNRFMQQEFQREIVNGLPPEKLYQKAYNPLMRAFTDVPVPDPFRPEKLLSQHQRLARGAPQPKSLPSFEKVVEMLVRTIANAYGVPPEVVESGKGSITAGVQFSTQQLNTTIQAYQRELERFIVQIYLDIHIDDHLDAVRKVMNEMNRARLEKAKSESAISERADEADAEEQPKRAKKRNFDNLLLTPQERTEIERSVTVDVHFNVNPSFDMATLLMYRDQRVISHEDFQRIALSMAGLPQSMALSRTDIEAEARQEAKRQKILNPGPGPKPDSPKSEAKPKEKKPKRTKTSKP